MGFGVDLGAKLGPSWGQAGIKIDKKRCQKKNEKRLHLEGILERIWLHLDFQKPPKMEPSWVQNRSKFGVDLRAIFERISVSFFVEFCTQHNIAEGTNVL